MDLQKSEGGGDEQFKTTEEHELIIDTTEVEKLLTAADIDTLDVDKLLAFNEFEKNKVVKKPHPAISPRDKSNLLTNNQRSSSISSSSNSSNNSSISNSSSSSSPRPSTTSNKQKKMFIGNRNIINQQRSLERFAVPSSRSTQIEALLTEFDDEEEKERAKSTSLSKSMDVRQFMKNRNNVTSSNDNNQSSDVTKTKSNDESSSSTSSSSSITASPYSSKSHLQSTNQQQQHSEQRKSLPATKVQTITSPTLSSPYPLGNAGNIQKQGSGHISHSHSHFPSSSPPLLPNNNDDNNKSRGGGDDEKKKKKKNERNENINDGSGDDTNGNNNGSRNNDSRNNDDDNNDELKCCSQNIESDLKISNHHHHHHQSTSDQQTNITNNNNNNNDNNNMNNNNNGGGDNNNDVPKRSVNFAVNENTKMVKKQPSSSGNKISEILAATTNPKKPNWRGRTPSFTLGTKQGTFLRANFDRMKNEEQQSNHQLNSGADGSGNGGNGGGMIMKEEEGEQEEGGSQETFMKKRLKRLSMNISHFQKVCNVKDDVKEELLRLEEIINENLDANVDYDLNNILKEMEISQQEYSENDNSLNDLIQYLFENPTSSVVEDLESYKHINQTHSDDSNTNSTEDPSEDDDDDSGSEDDDDDDGTVPPKAFVEEKEDVISTLEGQLWYSKTVNASTISRKSKKVSYKWKNYFVVCDEMKIQFFKKNAKQHAKPRLEIDIADVVDIIPSVDTLSVFLVHTSFNTFALRADDPNYWISGFYRMINAQHRKKV